MKKSAFIALAIVATAVITSCQNPNKSHNEVVVSENEDILRLSQLNQDASCIFITQDEKNQPAISWVEKDSTDYKSFYFSRFNATAREFDTPIAIPITQNASVHAEGMPKIAFKGDGSIFVIFETKEEVENSKWGLSDVKYIQSYDNGETWSTPQSVAVEDYAKGSSSSFANLSRLADGEIGVCWLGTSKTEGRPVKFVKTIGEELGEVLVLDEEACQCCRTAISSSENGHVSIAYRDLLEGSIRDISIAQSFDNGSTFEKAMPFSNDNWEVDGCPHAGPSINSFDKSTFVSWFTDAEATRGVNFAKLNENGDILFKKNISKSGHFNHLTILPNETTIITYSENYQEDNSIYGRIMAAKFENNQLTQKEITPPLVQANFPVVKALNDTEIIIAWVNENKAYYKIQEINAIDEKRIDNSSLAIHLIN